MECSWGPKCSAATAAPPASRPRTTERGVCAAGREREDGENDVAQATHAGARLVGVALVARKGGVVGDRVVVLGSEDSASEVWFGTAVLVDHERVRVDVDVADSAAGQRWSAGGENDVTHQDVGG